MILLTIYAIPPLAILAAAQAAYSGYQALKASQDRKREQQDAEKRLANMPVYQTPDALKNYYAEAQAGKNAINPAIAMQERQLQQAQANAMANAQRSATSGAEALSAGSKAQAMTQGYMPTLAEQQAAYQQASLGRADRASMAMTQEQMQKYENDYARSQSFLNYALGKSAAASQRQGQATAGVIQGLGTLANAYATNPDAFKKSPPPPPPPPPTTNSSSIGMGNTQLNNYLSGNSSALGMNKPLTAQTAPVMGSPVNVYPMQQQTKSTIWNPETGRFESVPYYGY